MSQRTPDDTSPVPWATTRTQPYAGRPAPAATAPPVAAEPAPSSAATAPALNPPTWSGRKTAIAAALAIGISSMGGVAAAAMLPAGSSVQDGRGFQGGQFPGGFGQQGQGGFGQQGQGQLPGQQGIQQGLPGGPRDDDGLGAAARTA
jgi:hypothetical protein